MIRSVYALLLGPAPRRFLPAIALFLSAPALAQDITGTVVDKLEKPIAGALVCVQGSPNHCTVSAADGAFHLTPGSLATRSAFKALDYNLEMRRGVMILTAAKATRARLEFLDLAGRAVAPSVGLDLARGANQVAMPEKLTRANLVIVRLRGADFSVTWKALLDGGSGGGSESALEALAKIAAAPILETTKDGYGPRVYKATNETETGVVIMMPNVGEVALFDGKTTDGWKGIIPGTWSVQNGALHGHGTRSLLITDGNYSNFRLFLRSKNVAQTSHLGICFWGQRDPAFGFGQCTLVMPHDGGQWDYHNGEGGVPHQSPPPKAASVDHGQWYYTEVLVSKDKKTIQMESEGVWMINHHNKESLTLWDGPIGLQIHDGTVTTEHKDIFVEVNPKEPDKLLYLKQ